MRGLVVGLVLVCILRSPAGAQVADSSPGNPATYQAAFEGADLRLVLSAIARAGGLNLILGEVPPRPVTLRINEPVHHTALRNLLRQVAETHGLSFREQSGLIRIETVAPAIQHQGVNSEAGRFFVYRVKHVHAAELAATLQRLFNPTGRESPPTSGFQPASLRSELQGIRLDATDPEARPPAMQPPGGTPLGSSAGGRTEFVADEATNSLLVRCTPADWSAIEAAIDALDLRPLQVLIEVTIAEVRRTRIHELSIGAEVPLQHESRSGAEIGGSLSGRTAGDLVLEVLSLGKVRADVVLSAISAKSDVSILSRPVILAQNNEEARILVGAERPFVQIFRTLPTDGGVRDQVVQYRDVGTSLTIRPTINLEGYVSLDVLQEVSTATAEQQFGAPVISTREAATRLFVKDGQTAILGGLIDQQQDRGASGVPILSDIPLLGRLFGSTESHKFRTELFILITPHIVRTDDDMDRLREGLPRISKELRKLLPPAPLLPVLTKLKE